VAFIPLIHVLFSLNYCSFLKLLVMFDGISPSVQWAGEVVE